MISILTFNAGLLRLSLFDRTVAAPTPFLEERVALMPQALLGINADVIAMQEIFPLTHRDAVVTALKPHYAHIVRFDTNRWPNLGNGMLLFSRFVVTQGTYHPFGEVDYLERLFVRKGVLLAELDVPHIGRVRIAATHWTAGGSRYSEDAKVVRTRQSNADHTIALLRSKPAELRLIAGDLNCGPLSTRAVYDHALLQGFRDAAVGLPAEQEMTWNPANQLNVLGSFAGGPARRIDHVLIDETSPYKARVDDAQVVFGEAIVPTSAGQMTLSDHCGVVVRLS